MARIMHCRARREKVEAPGMSSVDRIVNQSLTGIWELLTPTPGGVAAVSLGCPFVPSRSIGLSASKATAMKDLTRGGVCATFMAELIGNESVIVFL